MLAENGQTKTNSQQNEQGANSGHENQGRGEAASEGWGKENPNPHKQNLAKKPLKNTKVKKKNLHVCAQFFVKLRFVFVSSEQVNQIQ